MPCICSFNLGRHTTPTTWDGGGLLIVYYCGLEGEKSREENIARNFDENCPFLCEPYPNSHILRTSMNNDSLTGTMTCQIPERTILVVIYLISHSY